MKIYGYALSLPSVVFVCAAENWTGGWKSNTSDSKEKDRLNSIYMY